MSTGFIQWSLFWITIPPVLSPSFSHEQNGKVGQIKAGALLFPTLEDLVSR